MASIGHIAVGLAAGRAFSPADRRAARRAALVFSLVSIWPDFDAVGFLVGIRYRDPWGHRGATHSLLMALLVTLLGYLLARSRGLPPLRTALFTAVVAASHALLDTLTYGGGLGCALLWPLSNHRYWAPWRFIPISPIGLGLLSPYGVRVLLTEIVLFAPLWLYALWPRRRTG